MTSHFWCSISIFISTAKHFSSDTKVELPNCCLSLPVELKELLSSFEVKLDLDAVMKCAGQNGRRNAEGSRIGF